jgi:hypothetical protein
MRTPFSTGCALAIVSWLGASCAGGPTTTGETVTSSETHAKTSGTAPSTQGHSQIPPSVFLFNKTIIYIKDAYFDPARIHPRQMLVAALQSVARVTPLLRVETSESDVLRITSGDETRTFELASVDSLWKMAFAFSDFYTWLTGRLGIPDPCEEIGFAATNGMLSALDSRSKLLTSKEYEAASRPCPSCADNPPAAVLTSQMLSSGIGYLRVRNLPSGASGGVRQALSNLSHLSEHEGQLRGVVLDLRGSPGGLVEEAIRVTNLFVEDGALLTTVALGGRQRDTRRATRNGAATGAPLVVLVDEMTAGGAEIIAAALKDLDRATVVGQRTHGAGTVQVIYEFVFSAPDGTRKTYLKLTIAEMLRSSGAPIELGVVPDVALLPTGPVTEADAGVRSEDPQQEQATRLPTQERSLAEVSYPRTGPAAANEAFVEDFPIRFARDLLLRAPFARRSDMLSHAQPLAGEPR